MGQTALKLDALAAKAGYDKAEDFFAAFGRDEINSKQVQTAIQALALPSAPATLRPEPEVQMRKSKAAGSGAASSSSASTACLPGSRVAASRRRRTRSPASSRAARV
jgi:hypothetical protein